jgi:hypothetical protein
MPDAHNFIFNLMFFIVPIFGLLIFITAIGRLVFRIIRKDQFLNASNNFNFVDNAPNIPANAAVISKKNNYFVEFKFDTGDFINLQVDILSYNNISENDFGILVTKNNAFVSFDRENYATYKYPL